MRFESCFLLLAVSLAGIASPAQTKSPTHAKPAEAKAPAKLPAFSGTWILDTRRSKLSQSISGESKAIIEYDGKTWHYIHSHQETPAEEPDQWQTTLVVDSPKYNTVDGTDIVFHSRITRQGSAMVLLGYGVTVRGQKTRNTVRYTLEDDGNTLIESETNTNLLGPEHNLYVLHREGSPQAAK
jgi:hypothetical protein